MPIVGLDHGIPRPVGRFEVLENDSCLLVLLRRVTPDIVVTLTTARLSPPSPLEPGMLIGRMIDDQLGDHPKTTPMGFPEKPLEIAQGPVVGMNARVIGNIVTVVP